MFATTPTLSRARRALTLAALAAAFAAPVAQAQMVNGYRLADPVVALVPVIAKHVHALNLDAEQKAQFDDWVKTAKPQREAMEAKVAEQRLKLREMLLNGSGDAAEREALVRAIAADEAALMSARARCVDRMRAILKPAQMEQVVQLYRKGLASPQ
ncbi:Spy/CpxP family protein refolding chaperone [Tibeticola sp.]|uniref:Spy/CpxP family protein refolding chaperone n=1 Tax=Tibeticola sp. TaxID=2005368 RepID=UPI0025FE16D9|nr:Spy/CpxP family protein refolding chaperone [Tibeticola sp.]